MNSAVRAIAFYLPQFHPIPENDLWWGRGFTEWTNVTKAGPRFPGHYQPHLPADLGFYDLRLPEARQAQADLARSYGIHGFCYWHYWFNGQRILERPFNEVLSSGAPDFPFCLAWANENWSRRWNGDDKELLLEQRYGPEDDRAHIRWLIRAFQDPRYIKIDGRPLLAVYRVNLLPNPRSTAAIWREEVRRAGVPDPYLCTITGLAELSFDPATIGFDAAIEFQPSWANLPRPLDAPRNTVLGKAFRQFAPPGREAYWHNKIYGYGDVVEAMMAVPRPQYTQFPGVTPGWDNSARRAQGATILVDNSPELFGRWFEHALARARASVSADERLVFVNAWNEWAEGNHLEPDLKWGHQFLEVVRKALGASS